MKLLITSIDAIIDKKTKNYFDGVKEALDTFEKIEKGNVVFIISISQERLNDIPNDFEKLCVKDRRSPRLIKDISKVTKVDYKDFLLLGSKDEDLALSANARILLLTADYAKSNNSKARIYSGGYGIGILSPKRLKLFFERFLHVDKPWYYSVKIDESTKLYGLTNAMTGKMRDGDVRHICTEFRNFLKAGKDAYKNQFLIYSLICAYRIFKDMEDIDYWGYYPSSSTTVNNELLTLKNILRKSFNSRNNDDILIRHKSSPKRHYMRSDERIADGCDSQFDTIHINPDFKNKLKGANVCIIDDFTNFGTSCETVRHLLKEAGVNKIVFIALGKFRDEYLQYDYTLSGDVYKPQGFKYKRNNVETVHGKINNESSNELYESLNHILD